MLTHLQIKNYVLIDNLELSLSKGLTIITGETGAGKSILLGAIGLLLGQRAEARVLYDPQIKCIVEGTFDLSEYELEATFEEEDLDYSALTHIRREIAPTGKSRAFINDTPVTLDLLRRITERLVDIHSQHDSILLGNGGVQTDLLDAYGGNTPDVRHYHSKFKAWKDAEEALALLKREAASIRKENDYNQYLWQELDTVNLQPGELEALENEQAVLENASAIKSKFHDMSQYLDGPEISALSILNEVAQLLNQANRLAPAYLPLGKRLTDAIVELKDIAGDVEDVADGVEVNDERMETVSQRLDLLYQLIKKHQKTSLDELIEVRDELRQRITQFENLDEALQTAQQAATSAHKEMLLAGNKLSEARKACVPRFENLITETARDLGIPHAVFKVNLAELDQPSATGLNRIEFLFSANKGVPPHPLKQAASGGEFSRLMLAFKYAVAGQKQLGTLIFDEIDTGISGEIARKMGEMLRQMGEKHQLITITHLHQIAAFGAHHLYVYKDNSSDTTVSKIKTMSDEERVTELAQMIGGTNPSAAVVANARELLEKSAWRR
jgi:DNA repair protein RecN (Recombination protein N)